MWEVSFQQGQKDTEKENWAVISELALGKIPKYLSPKKYKKIFLNLFEE